MNVADTDSPLSEPHSADIAALWDREQIRDVLARYVRAIDRRDFALLRTCYHPGAIDHHPGFTGPVEEYIEWVREGLTAFSMTHHHIGQQLIELDGAVARVEAYGISTHWGTDADGVVLDLVTGSRYVDRMARREGEWRIDERFVIRDWTRHNGALIDRPSPGPESHPSSADHLYLLGGFSAAITDGVQ